MNNEIIIPELNSKTIESMIYEIRGEKVMLDFELAKIYGYETKTFNQQVKRNIEKFPNDFRFQLSKSELDDLARSQIVTARMWTIGNTGGRTILPYAFTEQGIYMLMTVLKGELATKQSITIIRAFKQMKDYIIESNNLVSTSDLFNLINKVDSNTKVIKNIKTKIKKIESNIIDENNLKHFLILDGCRIEADNAYQEIYRQAKSSVYLIDDYIDIKTLQLLKICNSNIEIIIFSDNKAKNSINSSFIKDFINDTGINIIFKKNNNRFHDRYIIIDYKTNNELIFHCGSSIKDSGKRITTINKLEFIDIYNSLIESILEKEE